jgi:hypothetical protein
MMKNFIIYEVITNDVSNYMNLFARIAHIICNHTYKDVQIREYDMGWGVHVPCMG